MNENQSKIEETQETEKVVPVSEAIRYRKRAQAAEQQAEELSQTVEQLRREHRQLAEQLQATRNEEELSKRLTAAGVTDIEVGVLLARKRMEEDGDLDDAIERLRKDKPYLFATGLRQTSAAPKKTAGARERTGTSPTIAQAAQQAAASGRRSDVHEYMRVRRTKVRSV
ncbi:MAG: hypothetical protein GX455_07265 [Phycisphaerae bacterium]|nr:hypothetical protein [Phycisphaerae bacterium]